MCARQAQLPLKSLEIVNLINSNSYLEQEKKPKNKQEKKRLIFAMLIEDEHLEGKRNRLSL